MKKNKQTTPAMFKMIISVAQSGCDLDSCIAQKRSDAEI